MEQLTELLRRLHKEGVEFSIVGGYAARSHGSSFTTDDVDVCVRLGYANLKKLERAVCDLNPRHRITANKLPFQLTESLAESLKNIYLKTDIGILDCLGEVAGIGDFDAVLNESELTDFSFGKCHRLKIDALIKAKEAVGRDHDIRTATELRAIQERSKSNNEPSR